MKRKDEGRIRNMNKSIGKETIKETEKKVEFSLSAPEAKEVFLTGEFNHWDIRSMPMKRGKGGNWRVHASLAPGRYEYKFVADNHWVEGLPGAELTANSFGTQNLVIRVE